MNPGLAPAVPSVAPAGAVAGVAAASVLEALNPLAPSDAPKGIRAPAIDESNDCMSVRICVSRPVAVCASDAALEVPALGARAFEDTAWIGRAGIVSLKLISVNDIPSDKAEVVPLAPMALPVELGDAVDALAGAALPRAGWEAGG